MDSQRGRFPRQLNRANSRNVKLGENISVKCINHTPFPPHTGAEFFMVANSDFNFAAYAERVAEMTDDELSEEGKQLRRLVYQKENLAQGHRLLNSGWRFVERNSGGGIQAAACLPLR